MKRALAVVVLLAGSVAAGFWVFAPAPTMHPASVEPCADDVGSCSAGAAPADTIEELPAKAPEAPDPPAPAPVAEASDEPTPAGTPEDGPRLRAEADRLIAEGKIPEGVAALRKATEADPSASNHGDLGSLLLRLTAMDEALVHLRRAADLDPGNADRWITLANAYYLKVNPGEAWKAERRAREAEPGLSLARNPAGLWVRKSPSAKDAVDDSAPGNP